MGLPSVFLDFWDLRSVSLRAELYAVDYYAETGSVGFGVSEGNAYEVWKKWPASLERDIVVNSQHRIAYADQKRHFLAN